MQVNFNGWRRAMEIGKVYHIVLTPKYKDYKYKIYTSKIAKK